MQDFETLIGQALAKGESIDSIAKQVTEAFNTALKQKQEAETASARDKMIEEVEKKFWSHMENEELSYDDAAALTWLIIVNDSEYGKSIKDPKVLDDLYGHVAHLLKYVEDSFKLTRGLKDTFGGITEMFDFDRFFDFDKDVNKREETKRAGTDRKSKSDRERIEEFLRSLK